MSFVAELKRRNVIRMAGLYLVVAWLVVQVAETVLPAFDVPSWVLVMLDDHGLALDFMERNAENLASSMTWAVMLPSMDPIRCEPRFVAIIGKLATTDPRFDAVCAAKPKGSGP